MAVRRLCRLQREVGRHEECPEDRCPFWESGSGILEGTCSIERVDLTVGAELPTWLLRLRRTLEEVREFPEPARGISAERFRAQPDAAAGDRPETPNRNQVDDRPST